ncbi:glycoside hydrolase family 127 protein [Lactobacillus sp. HT06-2]|uniref:glycoside hydrolase family 127 protein n=1 Tax=Lactobacillus sp. HT06-2 TaxID=2080222 RepID=UPI000CD7E6A9|nr:beta-L-arabinofuranosidase domain-containing protein [Lactobacillus sp. HT06-2]
MVENFKIRQLKITSPFWQRYQKMVAQKAIPFQWKMISDQEKPEVTSTTVAGGASDTSSAINNLKIAAGKLKGHHHGMIFQDTDVYKWLETVAYSLKNYPDEKLKQLADQVVDLIADAQAPDGYLSTRYQIDTPNLKFQQLQQSHELYSMGHYIEAGVAYYQSTGNKAALTIAEKMADCIANNFGQENGKIHGYDGHPEIEMALAKLYDCTQNKKYLTLADYFVKIRGTEPDFFSQQNAKNDLKDDPFPDMRQAKDNYFFDDRPLKDEKMAQGHAVRVLYYLTGAAHVARLTNDKELLAATKRLWQDITQRQMYVTGNVGQTAVGEAFTCDYDLPNRTDYGETCASVAMTMFAKQMLASDLSGQYGDVIERELYNGALAGISLDGEHYFYANPLEIDENSQFNPASSHLSMRRLSWFSCACCPANITRLIASLSKYIYDYNDKDKYILLDQLISNQVELGNGIKVEVKSDLPWQGTVKIHFSIPAGEELNFKVRIPSWSEQTSFKLNNHEIKMAITDGIASCTIAEDAELEMNLDLSVRQITANPLVVADQGKVAFSRGPIIYCAEEVDNPGNYAAYSISNNSKLSAEFESNLLGGVTTLQVDNAQYSEMDKLYSKQADVKKQKTTMKLIPYYAWANREKGSMHVWIRQSED